MTAKIETVATCKRYLWPFAFPYHRWHPLAHLLIGHGVRVTLDGEKVFGLLYPEADTLLQTDGAVAVPEGALVEHTGSACAKGIMVGKEAPE